MTTTNEQQARLWCRIGDSGSYEQLGQDLAAVASLLAEAGVDHTAIRPRYSGLEAPGYEGANYISLYWGAADATPIRTLTDDELTELREEMSRYT